MRQKALARRVAARHGVTCHVAQEISWAGQHKNAWGDAVALLDFAGRCLALTNPIWYLP